MSDVLSFGYKLYENYSYLLKKIEDENKKVEISSCNYNIIRESVSYLRNKYFSKNKEMVREFIYIMPSYKNKIEDLLKSFRDNMILFQYKIVIINKSCHHCSYLSHNHIFSILCVQDIDENEEIK